ncbi:hypothetical protein [Hyphomicrobium sp.]|uniref:hypothetical protein n=1 Tax=Hyphomicrobium sp. TaxID=82 RepID=UPI000FC2D8BD|nr:hypothetical protein [Hyphomicrobium sp.]RUO97752.1 MAG: hypothetical protein EKK30_13480 [Hyphomicrobium sp.]
MDVYHGDGVAGAVVWEEVPAEVMQAEASGRFMGERLGGDAARLRDALVVPECVAAEAATLLRITRQGLA